MATAATMRSNHGIGASPLRCGREYTAMCSSSDHTRLPSLAVHVVVRLVQEQDAALTSDQGPVGEVRVEVVHEVEAALWAREERRVEVQQLLEVGAPGGVQHHRRRVRERVKGVPRARTPLVHRHPHAWGKCHPLLHVSACFQ